MDSFFGIGLPELILILLLAGLVLGPQRIRDVARKLGRITAQLQKISREFARQLNAELDALDGDEVKGSLADFRKLQKEVQALRDELSQVPRSMVNEAKNAAADGQKVLSGDTGNQTEVREDEEPSDHDENAALPKPLDIPSDPDL